jgi:hypothetical protein
VGSSKREELLVKDHFGVLYDLVVFFLKSFLAQLIESLITVLCFKLDLLGLFISQLYLLQSLDLVYFLGD